MDIKPNWTRILGVLMVVAVCVGVVWVAVIMPIQFLLSDFNPSVNAADRLWALQSIIGDPEVCPYTWGGPENALMVHDCSLNMDAAVEMSWRVRHIYDFLCIAWLSSLAFAAGFAVGKLMR